MPPARTGRDEGVMVREVPPQGRAHAGPTDPAVRDRGRRRGPRLLLPHRPAPVPSTSPRSPVTVSSGSTSGRCWCVRRPGRELRLQVDEPTGTVQAVMLAGPGRRAGVPGVRRARATATCGPPCARRSPPTSPRAAAPPPSARAASAPSCCARCPSSVPTAPQATQPSRIIGVNGERWMLRASLLGRPALEPEGSGEWEDALAQVVVRRGSDRHARRRAAAGRAARAGPTGQLSAMPDTTGPAPHRSRLRRSLSRWADSEDQHARDLRKTHAGPPGETCIADAPDRERVRLRGTVKTVTLRPRGGVPALEAELDDGTGVIADRLAGPSPDRRRGPGPRDVRRGPDRHRDRSPRRVQPALRADPVTDPTAHPRRLRRDRRGGRAPPALPGPRRSPGHGRGRRAHHRLHGPVADHARAPARAGRQRRRGAGAARRTPGPALERAVRRQRAGGHRHRLVLRAALRRRRAAAPTTRRWPTSCPGSSTTPPTPWCWPSPA